MKLYDRKKDYPKEIIDIKNPFERAEAIMRYNGAYNNIKREVFKPFLSMESKVIKGWKENQPIKEEV